MKNSSKDTIHTLVFVDDLLTYCKDKNKINDLKSSLMNKLVIKYLSQIKSYVGMDVA